MTTMNPSQVPPRADNEEKKVTAPLGRGQLEQALSRALDLGPKAIGQQLRYVLALSQMTGAEPVLKPYPEKVLRPSQARLSALGNLAETLTEEQIQALINDGARISDVTVRMHLLAELALHLPPQSYEGLVDEMWGHAQKLSDPVARSRTLFKLAPLINLVHDEPATPSALLEVLGQVRAIRNVEARVRSLTALAPYLPYAMSIRTYERVLKEIEGMSNPSQQSTSIATMAAMLPDELKDRALTVAEAIESPADRARALTVLAAHLTNELRPRLREDALSAISTIQSEEERAEALIAFIPHLESATENGQYPELLEQALAIAISLSRRHIQARVLVALAPNLTLDLQGEALAAVHSLTNERDRAMMLAQLAPTLPPDMLVASLAVAHTMREQDARVHALTLLAHHAPKSARQQTTLDALAAASNLPHHFERVTALMGLVDILPPHLLDQALTNALETTRLIDNDSARARALNLIGSHLTDQLRLRALDIAREITNPQHRLNALLGIAPFLGNKHRHRAMEELIKCARDTTLEYKQARTLVSITPHLPQDLLDKVRVMADKLEDPFDQVSVYITLIQNLPPDARPPVVAIAWSLLKQIDDGYDRASILAAIAPYLPESAIKDLAQAAGVAIRSIVDEYDKASAVSILAPLFTGGDRTSETTLPDSYKVVRLGIEAALNVPQQSLRAQLVAEGISLWVGINDMERSFTLWREIVKRLKVLPLADVLLCLGAIMPLIRELVGKDGLEDVARILGVR